MELKNTVEYMLSDSYRDRFIGEYWQTKIRYEKLKAFNFAIWAANTSEGWEKNLEEPKHDCPRELLSSQEVSMAEYLETLEKRAAYEKINLTLPFTNLSTEFVPTNPDYYNFKRCRGENENG